MGMVTAITLFWSNKPNPAILKEHSCLAPVLEGEGRIYNIFGVWLGWAYMAKTVRKPQRGGVNFDPPMIFCACSMQNVPAASEMHQDDFRTK
jgi:hypothetical protein